MAAAAVRVDLNGRTAERIGKCACLALHVTAGASRIHTRGQCGEYKRVASNIWSVCDFLSEECGCKVA